MLIQRPVDFGAKHELQPNPACNCPKDKISFYEPEPTQSLQSFFWMQAWMCWTELTTYAQITDQSKAGDACDQEKVVIRWEKGAAESLAINVLPTSRPESLRHPKGQRIHQCKAFTWSHERSHKLRICAPLLQLQASASSNSRSISLFMQVAFSSLLYDASSGLARAKILISMNQSWWINVRIFFKKEKNDQ